MSHCVDRTIIDAGHMTSGFWMLYENNYMFEVETEEFDCDVFAAGEYLFEIKGSKNVGGFGPAIFDIYVSDIYYPGEYEIKNAYSKETFRVGGREEYYPSKKYIIKKGQYVYVIPMKDMDYKPSGYLSFTLVNNFERSGT